MLKFEMTMNGGLYEGVYCHCFHTSAEGAISSMLCDEQMQKEFEDWQGRKMVASDWNAKQVED